MVDATKAAFLELTTGEQLKVLAMFGDWASESYDEGFDGMAAFASTLYSALGSVMPEHLAALGSS